MALNWNIEKVKNLPEIQTDEEAPITDSLGGATMPVGIREITEENYKEFYARLNMAERMRGTYRYNKDGAVWMQLEDVKRRIGLYTNASTFSRAEFIKRMTKRHFEELVK